MHSLFFSLLYSLPNRHRSSDVTDMGSVAVHKFTNDPTKAWDMIKIAQKHVTLSTKPPNAPVTKTSVRFVCISDTHGMTSTMPDPIPQGDVLLHAGDITKDGHPKEINEFNTFLGEDVRCITRICQTAVYLLFRLFY